MLVSVFHSGWTTCTSTEAFTLCLHSLTKGFLGKYLIFFCHTNMLPAAPPFVSTLYSLWVIGFGWWRTNTVAPPEPPVSMLRLLQLYPVRSGEYWTRKKRQRGGVDREKRCAKEKSWKKQGDWRRLNSKTEKGGRDKKRRGTRASEMRLCGKDFIIFFEYRLVGRKLN